MPYLLGRASIGCRNATRNISPVCYVWVFALAFLLLNSGLLLHHTSTVPHLWIQTCPHLPVQPLLQKSTRHYKNQPAVTTRNTTTSNQQNKNVGSNTTTHRGAHDASTLRVATPVNTTAGRPLSRKLSTMPLQKVEKTNHRNTTNHPQSFLYSEFHTSAASTSTVQQHTNTRTKKRQNIIMYAYMYIYMYACIFSRFESSATHAGSNAKKILETCFDFL